MSKLLNYLRKGYNNPNIQTVKEWVTEHGEMGVYTVRTSQSVPVYHYVAVMTANGVCWPQQYRGDYPLSDLIEEAAVFATFANAQQREQAEGAAPE